MGVSARVRDFASVVSGETCRTVRPRSDMAGLMYVGRPAFVDVLTPAVLLRAAMHPVGRKQTTKYPPALAAGRQQLCPK